MQDPGGPGLGIACLSIPREQLGMSRQRVPGPQLLCPILADVSLHRSVVPLHRSIDGDDAIPVCEKHVFL